jgi:hypothetical protein
MATMKKTEAAMEIVERNKEVADLRLVSGATANTRTYAAARNEHHAL